MKEEGDKMKYILLLSLLIACSKKDYDYFLKKAPIYKGKTDFYFKETKKNSLIKAQITRDQLPISAFIFEMPFDFVIALDHQEYGMFEIINTTYKNTNLWFTLESLTTGEQVIGLPKDAAQVKMIKKIAKVLGIKTYPAKLAVKQNNHSLSVSFQHQHLENKKIWPIAFDVLFPKDSLEYDNGIYRPAHKNRMPERNSNGMNHSEDKFMAIIDIDRALHPLDANRLIFNDRSLPKLPIKKLFNQPVTTLISQTIIAIAPRKNNLDQHVVYQDTNNNIKILEATNIGAKDKRALVYFENELPTIQKLISKTAKPSRFKIKLENKDETLTFLFGHTKIKKKKNGGFYFVGMDERLSTNQQIELTPSWFLNRKIHTQINSNNKIESSIINMTKPIRKH